MSNLRFNSNLDKQIMKNLIPIWFCFIKARHNDQLKHNQAIIIHNLIKAEFLAMGACKLIKNFDLMPSMLP